MSVLIPLLLCGTLISLLYLWAKRAQNYWTRKGVPQIKPNIIFGNLGPLMRGRKSFKDTFYEFYQEANSKGYKYLGLYAGMTPDFMPVDLNLIKSIMTKDFNNFSSHGIFHHQTIKLSTHLFHMEGAEWKNRRAKLTPAFTSGKMKKMFETVAATADELTNFVADKAQANEPFNIKETLSRFTTDVIASVAFGLESKSLKDPEDLFRRIGKKALTFSMLNIFMKNFIPESILIALKFQMFSPEVINYFTDIVKNTINYREVNNVERNDFMQLMIQLKKLGTLNSANDDENVADEKQKYFVTDEEILNESFLFFLAGFETSSSTMTFTFFELAQNPQIQETLRIEILKVLEKHDGKITYDSLFEMEYLDKVVKETLRKYPVLPAIPRKCTKSYKIPDTDIIIEKGTRVHIPVIGFQWDPKYYPNPEEYNPENFCPEKIASRPDFTWIPFGEGPRQCTGMRFGLMQTKIGIVALLSKFNFTLHPSVKPPFEADERIRLFAFKKDIIVFATKIQEKII
ncbi:probable cytochrome P450 6a13 [Euwallacea similis]|uniref:probable cytochrome P450 6a13 n=1 Tax=Euwallacea similis TaxID=1736056 RepID=UPI00344B0F4A